MDELEELGIAEPESDRETNRVLLSAWRVLLQHRDAHTRIVGALLEKDTLTFEECKTVAALPELE